MKKFNVWIIFAIFAGLLCFGMLALYGYVLVAGREYYVDVDEEIEAESVSSDIVNIDTDLIKSFKEIKLDGFMVSYGSGRTKGALKNDDKDSDSDLQDTDEDLDSEDDYIIADSDKRKLTESDLEDLSPRELTYARNEIYARHGRKFQSDELQEYFDSKDWYELNEGFDDHDLQGVERQNAEFISEYQKDTGKNYKVK